MFNLSKFCRPLFLYVLTCATGACSPAVSPVLQVELNALPRGTARLDVTVTWNGSTGTAVFFRDGMNNYTTSMLQPSSMDSPPQASLALDLPVTTTGKVTIRAESRPVMGMGPDDLGGQQPAQPSAEAGGCATATITPGTLIKAAVSLLVPPPPSCS